MKSKKILSLISVLLLSALLLCSCGETLKIEKTGDTAADVKSYAEAVASQLCEGYSEDWFFNWRGATALFFGTSCYVVDVEDELGNIVCNIAVSGDLKKCYIDENVEGDYKEVVIKNGEASVGQSVGDGGFDDEAGDA